jgi:HPt (histidine-containing phosphotransfer) domain-containing protein
MAHTIVSSATVLDSQAAIARLGNDIELFSDLIEFFSADAPELMTQLQVAQEAGQMREVRMKAHALKGLISGCGGVRGVLSAQAVEDAAVANRADLPDLVSALEAEIAELEHALSAHRRPGAAR